MLSANNIKELVDPYLADAYDEEQMKHIILTASLCIDQSSVRPQMKQAGPLHIRYLDLFYEVDVELDW